MSTGLLIALVAVAAAVIGYLLGTLLASRRAEGLRVELEGAEYWDSPGGLVGNALYLAAAAVTGEAGVLSENESMELARKPA